MDNRYRIKSTIQESRNYLYVQSRIYDKELNKSYQRKRSTGLKRKNNLRKAQGMIPEMEQQILSEFCKYERSSSSLMEEYVQVYLDKIERIVKANTFESYASYAKKHILPQLGNVPVTRISYRILQEFCDKLLETHSVKSVRRYFVVVKGALDEAMRDGVLTRNPAELVEFPTAEKYKGESLTLEELRILYRGIINKGEPLLSCILLASCYGLRRSEVLGLRWQDIDFEKRDIHICNTVVHANGELLESNTTKTNKSDRHLAMIKFTIPILEELRQKQKAAHLKTDKVVCFPDGRRVRPDYISKAFPKLLESCGLSHYRFHDLRRTVATLLTSSGEVSLKQVQEFMGHADISTTMNIYTDVQDTDRVKTSSAMDSIIDSSGLCYSFCYSSEQTDSGN